MTITRGLLALAVTFALSGCTTYADRLTDQGWRDIGGDIRAKCDGPNMVYLSYLPSVFVVANDKRCGP